MSELTPEEQAMIDGYTHYDPNAPVNDTTGYYDFYQEANRNPTFTNQILGRLNRINEYGRWRFGDQWQDFRPDAAAFADAMSGSTKFPSSGGSYYGYDIDYDKGFDILNQLANQHLGGYAQDLVGQNWYDAISPYEFAMRTGKTFEEQKARFEESQAAREATEAEAARLGISVNELRSRRAAASQERRQQRELERQQQEAYRNSPQYELDRQREQMNIIRAQAGLQPIPEGDPRYTAQGQDMPVDASFAQSIMDQYRQGGQRFETIPFGMDMYGRFNNPYGSGYYGTQGVNRSPMQDGVAGLPTTPNPMGKGGTSPLYQYMFANYQHDPNRVAPTAYLDQYGGAQAGETYLVGNQAIGQTYIPQQGVNEIQNFMGQMGKGGYQLPTLGNPYELDGGRYAQSIGGKGGMTSTDPSMGKGGMGKGG